MATFASNVIKRFAHRKPLQNVIFFMISGKNSKRINFLLGGIVLHQDSEHVQPECLLLNKLPNKTV